MKDKVLKAAVEEAVENLTKALRNYTGEPMNLFLTVFTRDQTVRADGEPDSIPDYYCVTVRSSDCELATEATYRAVKKVYYSDDDFGIESIRTVIPCFEEGEEEDES